MPPPEPLGAGTDTVGPVDELDDDGLPVKDELSPDEPCFDEEDGGDVEGVGRAVPNFACI